MMHPKKIVVILLAGALPTLLGLKSNDRGAERDALRFTQERLLNINVDILEGCLVTDGRYPPGKTIRALWPLAEKMLMNWRSEKYRENWYRDGWGNEIRYVTSPDALRYVLASPGKNRKFEENIESYLWISPRYNRRAFTDKDPLDDSISANNCDIRSYDGMPSRCELPVFTRVSLMNIRDALKVHFQVKGKYPRSLDVSALQMLIRDETKLPYELFGGDTDYPITYVASDDGRKYVLGADWTDRRFNVELRSLLELEGRQLEIAALQLSEDEWVYHTGKLISPWPENPLHDR